MACCKDCKDRVPFPNCHSTCERYLNEVKEHKRINAKRLKEKLEVSTIMKNNKQRTNKRSHNDIMSTNKSHRRSK